MPQLGSLLDEPDIPIALDHLVSPKREATQEFVDFVRELTDDTQILPAEFRPAVRMKAIKMRSAMRVKFCDELGRGVEPGTAEFTIVAQDSEQQAWATIRQPNIREADPGCIKFMKPLAT